MTKAFDWACFHLAMWFPHRWTRCLIGWDAHIFLLQRAANHVYRDIHANGEPRE